VKGECNLWRRRVSLKQPSTDQRVSGSLLSAQTRSIDPTIGHLRSRCEAEKGGRPCALRAERLHELDIESNSDLVSNEDSQVSRDPFQVKPKSFRLIFVVTEIATRVRVAASHVCCAEDLDPSSTV
jgi:hypothetical protein